MTFLWRSSLMMAAYRRSSSRLPRPRRFFMSSTPFQGSQSVVNPLVPRRGLVHLEPLTRELQRAAVLGHRPHDLVTGAVRKSCLDLEHYRDLRSNLSRKVGNHFLGDAACVTANASGVE